MKETKADSPKMIPAICVFENPLTRKMAISRMRVNTDMIIVLATPSPPRINPQHPTAQAVAFRILNCE